VAYFKTLTQHSTGEIYESHGKPPVQNLRDISPTHKGSACHILVTADLCNTSVASTLHKQFINK